MEDNIEKNKAKEKKNQEYFEKNKTGDIFDALYQEEYDTSNIFSTEESIKSTLENEKEKLLALYEDVNQISKNTTEFWRDNRHILPNLFR